MVSQQALRWVLACVIGGLALSGSVRADSLWTGGDAPLTDEEGQLDTNAACSKDGPACCCSPWWSAGGAALILQRRDPGDGVLAYDFHDPSADLDGADFDFGFQGGYEVWLTRHAGDSAWPGVEVRFFAVDGWSAGAAVPVTPGNPIQINNVPPTFLLGSITSIDAAYASQLYNTEINLRFSPWDGLTALAGFRYLELDEHLGMAFAGTPVTYDVAVRNRLYGAQGGLEFARCFHRWELSAVGKAGIYGNGAAQDTQVWTGAFAPEAHGQEDTAAFIGELGVNAKWSLTDHLALLAGYRLLWVEGVALASEQIAAADLTAQSGIDAESGVFYHGFVLGIEGTW